jgi:hypothetical protein
MELDYEEIFEFLSLDLPQSPDEVDTFLDIAGYPHYEEVISNIYAYYLDKEAEHGFKDLFFTALCNAIKKKAPEAYKSRLAYLQDWSEWEVYREVAVKRKRIDILLEETSGDHPTCIMIENKIFHSLDNPLATYWSYTDSDRKLGVVLTMRKTRTSHEGFINITHAELLQEIKNLQGHYLETASSRDLFIVKDLIINLKQLEGMKEHQAELLKFYQEHKEKIESVFELRTDVVQAFVNEVNSLGENRLGLSIKYKNAKDYRGLIDKENPDIQLIFLFDSAKKNIDKLSFEVRLELHGELYAKESELLDNQELFRGFSKRGLLKEKWSHAGSWFSLACKYYSFSDLDYDMTNLFEIYKTDWEPSIKELKAVLAK